MQFKQKLDQLLPNTGDLEPEQAIKFRLSIGLVILIIFAIPWHENETVISNLLSVHSLIIITAYICALLLVVAIYLNPKPSPLRRLIGIFLDITSLSTLMFVAGSEGTFLFVFYLWIILGNGFRFGQRYLYSATALGFFGFSVVILFNEFWVDPHHQLIGISLLLLLVLVPIYASFLVNKLHQAIAEAKQANEAKSRFLANMSHELRTPLNGVIGIADLLGETSLTQRQYELVTIMRNSANTLLSLIQKVLDISKIEAGKIIIQKEEFDLHKLINSIIELQVALGAAKGLSVSYCIDSHIDFNLKGDPQHLRQVLINLLGNAIKFTESGSVKLLVSQVSYSTIRFEVEDTGIGISQDNLKVIFEDFTQLATVSSNIKYQGTGLGTTIAKQLIELMGGEIGVSSQLGKGTTFWFELGFEHYSRNDLKLGSQKTLILGSKLTAEFLSQKLQTWEMDFVVATTIAQCKHILSDIQQSNTLRVLIDSEHFSSEEISAFISQLRSEFPLQQLALILINYKEDLVHNSTFNQYCVTSVADITDSRTLFNALHAVEASTPEVSNVVNLNDYYHSLAEDMVPLTILIAEDNQVNQRILRGMLEPLEHELHIASDGEQAIDIINNYQDSLDLLILDMNLPEYSGIEIIQAANFLARETKIPAFVVTADATPEARQRCIDAGADFFMTKPINSTALLKEIAKVAQAKPKKIAPTLSSNELISKGHLTMLSKLGSDKHFLESLLESFHQDCTKHIEQIQNAVGEDYYQYRESLHALKGSATEMGTTQLAQLCRDAEMLRPEQINSDKLKQLVNQIDQLFEASFKALRNEIEKSHQVINH